MLLVWIRIINKQTISRRLLYSDIKLKLKVCENYDFIRFLFNSYYVVVLKYNYAIANELSGSWKIVIAILHTI